LSRVSRSSRHAARGEPVREDALADLSLTAQHNVFDEGHLREGPGDLKCAPQPRGDATIRGGGLHLSAFDEDASGIHGLAACEQIEHRRLAGAVGADESRDFAGPHTQRDAVDRREAAEALDEVLRHQDRHGLFCFWRLAQLFSFHFVITLDMIK
jgi:hypothetical protein